MGKITTYLAIMSFVVLGFHYAGIVQNTPVGWFLTAIKNLAGFSNNSFYTTLTAVLATFGGATIIIGAFAGSKIEQGATIAFTTLLLTLAWELIAIWNVLQDSMGEMFSTLLISPIVVIYVLTVLEWWRGRD